MLRIVAFPSAPLDLMKGLHAIMFRIFVPIVLFWLETDA